LPKDRAFPIAAAVESKPDPVCLEAFQRQRQDGDRVDDPALAGPQRDPRHRAHPSDWPLRQMMPAPSWSGPLSRRPAHLVAITSGLSIVAILLLTYLRVVEGPRAIELA